MTEITKLTNEEILDRKGRVIVEDKTKIIYQCKGHPLLCIVFEKNAISSHDDILSTVGKSIVFELLETASISTLFIRRLSKNEFLAIKTKKIPVYTVASRYATDSFIKRKPVFANPNTKVPIEFEDICIEFFLKTINGSCIFDKNILKSRICVDDPFISDPRERLWVLLDSEKAYEESISFVGTFNPKLLIDPYDELIEKLTSETKKIFEILEKAWKDVSNWRLSECTIEFGLSYDGEVLISDISDISFKANDLSEIEYFMFDAEAEKIEAYYL